MSKQRPLTRSEEKLLADKKRVLLQKREEFKDGLPFLYGHKWYSWQRQFYNSRCNMRLFSAGNQLGKSSVHQWDKINRATNLKMHEEFWPGRKPDLFWYWMTDQATLDREVKLKWMRWLPQGAFKDSDQYGWKLDANKKGEEVKGIIFNSGITLEFKLYTQSPRNIQSATVFDMGCFPHGTPIITKRGTIPIEQVVVGDLALSEAGWKPVEKVMTRRSDVLTREFENGEIVRATPEHPYWTKNRGWIAFSDLKTSDICVKHPLWNLIKKSYYSKVICTRVFRKAMTFVSRITLEARSVRETLRSFSMSLFGKAITAEPFQMDMLSITKISSPLIIDYPTSSCSPEASTPQFTSLKSGKKKAFTNVHARNAEKFSKPGALRNLLGSVLLSVEGLRKLAVAYVVEKSLKSGVGQANSTRSELRARQNVAILKESNQEVINLTVADSHTYFANGILVHNCDEEMPLSFWDEASQRISSTGRHFSTGFTATLNQLMWWRALEGKGASEKFPDAFKLQVSKFDCLVFDDGSPGLYTEEQIHEEIKNCSSEAQVNRRIYGKFAPESGLKYHAFDPARHYIDPVPIPIDWLRYSGVDIGSGGDKNHPGAFFFIAVRPDMKLGYVFKGRRLDDIVTTAGDILNYYIVERASDEMTDQAYDYHSKEFGLIAERAGESFSMANKSHELGEDTINTLFANDMLFLFDTPEVRKIGEEMLTLMKSTDKRKAVDDAIDSCRYGLMCVPWDWTAAIKKLKPVDKKEEKPRALTNEEYLADEIKRRRGETKEDDQEGWGELGAEIDFWNSLYSGF